MTLRPIRLAVRAIIMREDRLLLVNAYPGGQSDLWCAPGGGVRSGTSLPDNLKREVHEETGLTVAPGPLALVNEFHDPASGFHQVELFFRATIIAGQIDHTWRDSAGIVTSRRYFAPAELAAIRFKPDSLATVAFGPETATHYDALEQIVR